MIDRPIPTRLCILTDQGKKLDGAFCLMIRKRFRKGVDMSFQVRDEASPRTNFTMMPNMVDDMKLSPHAFRLYMHFRRVVSFSGKCYQSIKTLSEICSMSTGKVSEAKAELVKANLIKSEILNGDHGTYSLVTVKDIWEENANRGVTQNMGKGHPEYEHPSPEYETINIDLNNISNEVIYKTEEPELHILTDKNLEEYKASSFTYGKPKPVKSPKVGVFSKKDYDDTDMAVRSIIGASDKARTKTSSLIPEQYKEMADWFINHSQIQYIPTKNNQAAWISAFEVWRNLGVTELDVDKAVERLFTNGYKVTSPQSLTNTLNGIVAERKKSGDVKYNPWS